MARAVFFDWFTTLADYSPPRYQLYCHVFGEQGIEIPADKAIRGILLADEYLYTENMKQPLAQRSSEERMDMYRCFPKMILSEAQLDVPAEISLKVRDQVKRLFANSRFVLFDDVITSFKALKKHGLKLGIITNLKNDINLLCRELGLESYLDVALTSNMVGAAKPSPLIFQAALGKTGVATADAIYVGDQYQVDILGARKAGMKPVLIDRYDLYPQITDCPRIKSLTELTEYL